MTNLHHANVKGIPPSSSFFFVLLCEKIISGKCLALVLIYVSVAFFLILVKQIWAHHVAWLQCTAQLGNLLLTNQSHGQFIRSEQIYDDV